MICNTFFNMFLSKQIAQTAEYREVTEHVPTHL